MIETSMLDEVGRVIGEKALDSWFSASVLNQTVCVCKYRCVWCLYQLRKRWSMQYLDGLMIIISN